MLKNSDSHNIHNIAVEKKQRTKKRNKELSKPWVGGTGVVSFRSSSGVNSVCRRVGCYEF